MLQPTASPSEQLPGRAHCRCSMMPAAEGDPSSSMRMRAATSVLPVVSATPHVPWCKYDCCRVPQLQCMQGLYYLC